MWAETIEDGLELLREARPSLVIMSDRLDAGPVDPVEALGVIEVGGLACQVIVKTAEPDFDRAMDWVSEGVFSVVSSPIDPARLRTIAGRALSNRSLMEALAETAMATGGRETARIYKSLAGRLESGPLLQALCDTTRCLTGAACVEAGADLGGSGRLAAISGPAGRPESSSLGLQLTWKGVDLGHLRLGFKDPEGAGRVDPGLIDELVQAGSMFLGQSMRYEEAVSMASLDPLTGLCNRRVFLETLDREFKQARRHGTPLTLLTLDLDHFKNVNDTYGHQTGDEVLKWLSQALSRLVRSGDLPARIGGEEFAVVLPRTSIEQAVNLATRLQEALRDGPWPEGLPQMARPTVSQGLSGLEHFLVNSTQDLIYWSDQAMYLAKREGRDAVRVISDLPGQTEFQDATHVYQ
jgi:diguanylate cyclase (GGDEF)-like protein